MTPIIAMDVGSGFTKYLRVPESGATEAMQKGIVSFKTAVGPARDIAIQPGHKPLIVEFGDHRFFVGQTAEIALNPSECSNTLSPTWAYDDGHKALIYYVIARVLDEGKINADTTDPVHLRLVTGLPQAYYDTGAQKVIDMLRGAQRFVFKGKKYHIFIDSVAVVPQAMGAYYTATETFLNENEISERIGVIDIGTFTSDFCLSEDIQYKAWESGGADVGVSQLVAYLGKLLETKQGTTYSEASIRRALQSKTVLSSSERINISDTVDEAINYIGSQLIKALPATWDLDAMHLIIAGGGAESYIFGDWFRERYGHARQLPFPSNSIVLGYGIYAASLYIE